MIPTEQEAIQLWEKYSLPEKKRIHVRWIAKLALFLSRELRTKGIQVNDATLLAGCLLHDIDKNIPRLPGEFHPQTGVRILRNEGMDEVADLIQYHSVQYIENPETAPKTWEEKLLFLCDKMVKQSIIGVEERFRLWYAEDDLPQTQKEMLHRVEPLVKQLEQEVFALINNDPFEVAKLLETN